MSHADEGTLHAHLDGELAEAEQAHLTEHLATCAGCRARLDEARQSRARAHEILRMADPPAVIPPAFHAVVDGRSDSVRTRPSARPLVLPWAASIILAIGVGWFAQTLLRDAGEVRPEVAALDRSTPQPADAVAASSAGEPEQVEATTTPDATSAEPARYADPAASTRQSTADEPAAAVQEPPPEARAGVARPTAAALTVAEPPPWPEANGWEASDPEEIRRILGRNALSIDGIPVEQHALAADGSNVARVVQRLPGGGRLEILQRPAGEPAAPADAVEAAEWMITPSGGGATLELRETRGELEIRLRAAIPADSLQRLRRRLR